MARRETPSEDFAAERMVAQPECCGKQMPIPNSIAARIKHWAELGGEGGYIDPALLLECPHCQTPLRMNPFFAEVRPLSN